MKYLYSIIIAFIIAIALHVIPAYINIKTNTVKDDIKNSTLTMYKKANKVIADTVVDGQISKLEFDMLCQSLEGIYGYGSITNFFIFQSGDKICFEPKNFKAPFYNKNVGENISSQFIEQVPGKNFLIYSNISNAYQLQFGRNDPMHVDLNMKNYIRLMFSFYNFIFIFINFIVIFGMHYYTKFSIKKTTKKNIYLLTIITATIMILVNIVAKNYFILKNDSEVGYSYKKRDFVENLELINSIATKSISEKSDSGVLNTCLRLKGLYDIGKLYKFSLAYEDVICTYGADPETFKFFSNDPGLHFFESEINSDSKIYYILSNNFDKYQLELEDHTEPIETKVDYFAIKKFLNFYSVIQLILIIFLCFYFHYELIVKNESRNVY